MTELLLPPATVRDPQDASTGLTPVQAILRQMVLDAVTSPSTRHSYGRALDHLFAFSAGRPLTRALLQEWKASMGGLSASTVNVRLSAIRELVEEARRNGMLGAQKRDVLDETGHEVSRSQRATRRLATRLPAAMVLGARQDSQACC